MSVTHATITPLGEGGWTCSSCKMFVPNGCTHSCPTTYLGTGSPAPPLPMSHEAVALQRVAAALESIAKALAAARTKEEA